MINRNKYAIHTWHHSILVLLLGWSRCSSPSTKELNARDAAWNTVASYTRGVRHRFWSDIIKIPAVWPDLAKFFSFFANTIFEGSFSIWAKIWTYFGKGLKLLGTNSFIVKGLILKKIISHLVTLVALKAASRVAHVIKQLIFAILGSIGLDPEPDRIKKRVY